MKRLVIALAVTLLMALGACSSSDASGAPGSADLALSGRMNSIATAVDDWGHATTLPEAKAGAEAALNLVVGAAGPFYGDGDGDGQLQGASDNGLLPGLHGEQGLAQSEPINACVGEEVLGGAWEDPGDRWDVAAVVYSKWTPSNNIMPTLASHPQRIVGWAILTLASDSLDEAHDYARNAQLHVDVSQAAIEACSR